MSRDPDYTQDYRERTNQDAVERVRELEAEVERLRDVALFLWDRLDDIDTLDDACREDDRAFRGRARAVQRMRFKVGTTDGYSVTFPAALTDAT